MKCVTFLLGSSDGGSSGFGNQVAPGFVQGQPGFGGQSNNNFGPTGGSTQCKNL